MFTNGRRYSRREISDRVGGDLQSFLPSHAGRVVAACLDERLNPDAPTVILPGRGPGRERAAARLVDQRGPVPVFMKLDVNVWQYVGDYRVERSTADPTEIADHERHSRRADIARVIVMSPVRPNT